jgi:hypothetical protein
LEPLRICGGSIPDHESFAFIQRTARQKSTQQTPPLGLDNVSSGAKDVIEKLPKTPSIDKNGCPNVTLGPTNDGLASLSLGGG